MDVKSELINKYTFNSGDFRSCALCQLTKLNYEDDGILSDFTSSLASGLFFLIPTQVSLLFTQFYTLFYHSICSTVDLFFDGVVLLPNIMVWTFESLEESTHSRNDIYLSDIMPVLKNAPTSPPTSTSNWVTNVSDDHSNNHHFTHQSNHPVDKNWWLLK